MRDPDFSVDLEKATKPLVYAFIDADANILYVGMSSIGLSRPFSRDHHVISKQRFGKVLAWCCDSKDEALALEYRLIAKFAPPLNSQTLIHRELSEDEMLDLIKNSPRLRDDEPTEQELRNIVNSESQTSNPSTHERLHGHKPGCGCSPDDWLAGKTIPVASDIV